ncbi:M48 family metalloprotease [Micromonospora sp. ATCC 39149]|uniref:Peptidase M48 domain-containing protein n=1 Tax=Micromonospora carbonacea TaxID=47853 RepID=A0A7D5Y9U8_9ACTN|nr:M48 family metalloprotease [Micromonospora sp. ATCC 39149]QLJ98860.1 hypothetical protein HZU44_01165 [Micromonospora carbonacea]
MARPAVSGTTLRFAALVAAVLGSGTHAFTFLYLSVPQHVRVAGVTYARCVEAYQHSLPAPDADFDTYVAAGERAQQEIIRCLAPVGQPQAVWVLVGLSVLLALAAVLYLATPWWIRRRGRLVELTADAFPRLHAELGRLSTVAGLDRPPVFLLDPAAGAPGGLAFGRAGRYAVRLNAGLVPLSITDPGLFRAVVLHELAHVRNRDVSLAYAVVALWRAFVAVALVPLVVLSVYPTLLTDPGQVPWDSPDSGILDDYFRWDVAGYGVTTAQGTMRALLFVGVLYLARNAVLRARETYADARAAEFGAGADLRRVVAAAAARRPAPGWRGRLGRFGVHPTAATRLATIDDPTRAHRPGFGELFGAGLTTMIAFDCLAHYARALPHTGAAGAQAAAWLVAPVVTGILGAVAWRAWQSPEPPADRTRRLVTATLGFSLGWLVGDVMSLSTVPGDWGVLGASSISGQVTFGSGPVMGGYDAGSALVAALLLTGGMLAQAGVLFAAARSWSARGATGRWAWAAGAAVTAVPFAAWIGIWFDVHAAPYLVGHLYSVGTADLARVGVGIWQGPGFALLTLFYPPVEILRERLLVVPVLALAWLYPLAAGLRPWWRRWRAASGSPPAADATGPGHPARPREVPAPDDPRIGEGIRAALRVALLGAAGFAVALLATRAAVRLFAPERAGAADFPGYFYFAQIAAATLVQAVVGGWLTARRRPLGLVLGQLGAMVVAVLATVAILGAQTLGGCLAAFRFASSICRPPNDLPWALRLLRTLAVEGALAALLAGVAVVVASELARRLAARMELDGSAARRAWSAALLVLLLSAGGLAAQGVYASGEGAAVATARPSASASVAPRSAGPGRPLTAAEATAAVRAAERAVPPGWQQTAENEEDSSAQHRYDPAGCRPLATGAYRRALEAGKRASARSTLTNGGRLASTTVEVDVVSYATAVPESVLRDAERKRVNCPRFTVTTATGFQVAYEVRPGAALPLGDQAWRVDYDMSTPSSPPVRGRWSEAIVRVDHTLVTVSMIAVGEPLDEVLLGDLLTRAVSALPR